MLTKDKIIGIFCFIDDLLKTSKHYEDSRRQVSDSEIITTAIISSLHFGGHQDKARQFMKMTGFVPNMLDKSRFNRRLHALAELIYSLFTQVGYYFKYISCEMSYVLDSFPVAVCDNIRISKGRKSYIFNDLKSLVESRPAYEWLQPKRIDLADSVKAVYIGTFHNEYIGNLVVNTYADGIKISSSNGKSSVLHAQSTNLFFSPKEDFKIESIVDKKTNQIIMKIYENGFWSISAWKRS